MNLTAALPEIIDLTNDITVRSGTIRKCLYIKSIHAVFIDAWRSSITKNQIFMNLPAGYSFMEMNYYNYAVSTAWSDAANASLLTRVPLSCNSEGLFSTDSAGGTAITGFFFLE